MGYNIKQKDLDRDTMIVLIRHNKPNYNVVVFSLFNQRTLISNSNYKNN